MVCKIYDDFRRGISLIFVPTLFGITGQVFPIPREDRPSEIRWVNLHEEGQTNAA